MKPVNKDIVNIYEAYENIYDKTLKEGDMVDENTTYRPDLKVGDLVQGIMGVDGGKEGTVEKIGAPYSTSGAATVWINGPDGKWDTYIFNLKKIARLGQPRFKR